MHPDPWYMWFGVQDGLGFVHAGEPVTEKNAKRKLAAIVPESHADDAQPLSTLALQWAISFQRTRRGISVADPVTGLLTSVNPAFAEMHGGAPEDFVGEPLRSVFAPRAFEHAPHWDELASTQGYVRYATEHRRLDGSTFPVVTEVVAAVDDDGRPLYRVAYVEDVTQSRATELAFARSSAVFERVFEGAPVGMAVVDPAGRVARANDAFLAVVGLSGVPSGAGAFDERVCPLDRERELAARTAVATGSLEVAELEVRYCRPDGSLVFVHESISAVEVPSDDGAEHMLVLHLVDITDRKRSEAELRWLADRDALTGLMNRRSFEQELASRARGAREGADALLIVDLDDFKHVNDTYGHQAGDAVLVAVGQCLRETLRGDDLVARLGGDEFAVLLRRTDVDSAKSVAHALCAAIAALAVEVAEQMHFSPTASIGVSSANDADVQADQPLRNADLAMYDAKSRGRNQHVVYGEDRRRHRRITNDLEWSRRLRAALAEDRLVLFSQPIVDLQTGDELDQELLVRMIGEDGQTIPPAAFMGAAERYRLVGELDEWVVRHAVHIAAARPGQVFSVNLSGSSVADPALGARVERLIREAGCEPSQLVFEVTETEAIASMSNALSLAHTLSQMGCRLALDDFGSGFASFYHLKRLPLEFIKLDGEFVRHLPVNRHDQLVVQAVQTVADGMGRTVIAEQIEDQTTVELLRAAGVRYGQGYHFARPTAVEPVPRAA